MALPVGKSIESNKELELVVYLLEKTLKELEETKKGFEELKIKDQEKQESFRTFVNKVIDILKEKEYNPTIKVSAPNVWVDDKILNTVKQAIEPKKFWSFTGKETVLLATTFITIILLGVSLNYNFNTSKVLKSQNKIIAENQKKLFDIYRQESKFWFSKTHQKAYATSIVNGELDKAMKQDEKEYQEKLKAEKGKFKLNK